MALSKDQLKKDLLAMMDKGGTDPAWTKEKAADAPAVAIDAYVRSGAVAGVKVQAVGAVPGIPPGTLFSQTTEVHLQ